MLSRGFPIALALLGLGTAITITIWTLAGSRALTLDSVLRAASRAEIDAAVQASSLEAELLLIGAGLVWLGVIVAVLTANRLARLRALAARQH